MAAETPTALVQVGPLGMDTLLRATFGATVDDADTWASGLGTRVTGFWTQDIDNPTTQGSVGVAVTNSSGTFTFYPAEDDKAFYLFVTASGA